MTKREGVEITKVVLGVHEVRINGELHGTATLVRGGWVYFRDGEAFAVGRSLESAVRTALLLD